MSRCTLKICYMQTAGLKISFMLIFGFFNVGLPRVVSAHESRV